MSERFVPIPPEIIGMHLGPALELYIFLVCHQTSADGLIFYGKPIGYAWIAHRWPGNWEGRPDIRSLKRRMKVLREKRLVETCREWHGGIVARLLLSVKFAKTNPAAAQLALPGFSGIAAMRRPVENPVKKQRISCESPDFKRDESVPIWAAECPDKEVRSKS